MKTFIIVSGYLKTQKGVLLVANKWRSKEPVSWSLPGGTWEQGKETVIAALKREFLEETGMKIKEIGDPLYITESVSESRKEHFMNITFNILKISAVNATKKISDRFVVESRFVSSKKIKGLTMLPSIKKPLLEYISGDKKIKFYHFPKTFSTD